jgi:hypothetical protein
MLAGQAPSSSLPSFLVAPSFQLEEQVFRQPCHLHRHQMCQLPEQNQRLLANPFWRMVVLAYRRTVYLYRKRAFCQRQMFCWMTLTVSSQEA